LGLAEQRLAGFDGSAKDAISTVAGWTTGRLWTAALEALVARGALQPAEDRFLGVRWRTRWPTADPGLERELIAHLRAHVARDAAGAPSWEDALLSLARGTRILASIWPDDEALERARPALLRCTARAPLGRDVRALIDEAADAATIAAISASS